MLVLFLCGFNSGVFCVCGFNNGEFHAGLVFVWL